MLVRRISASPIPATMIPPGPGSAPTIGDTISRIKPSANVAHSKSGLSTSFRHFRRVHMECNLGRQAVSGKAACPGVSHAASKGPPSQGVCCLFVIA